MQKLIDALDEFEKVQSKYRKFGAFDTEPDAIFHCLIMKTLQNKLVILPKTAQEWDLYSSMNCTEAINALNLAAKKVLDIVKEMSNDHSVHEYLKDYCWRY